jgi:triosephosphate isomerase
MSRPLTAPFFEIGPKTFLSRAELLEVAAAAAAASAMYDVSVVYTPPVLDLELIKASAPDLWVFAQGMDLAQAGSSTGSILPEALRAIGADGVLLNHAERALSDAAVVSAIGRAQDNDLLTIVCADDEAESRTIARHGPDIILAEPRLLIGTASHAPRPWIPAVNAAVTEVDPHILVMHGGGIADSNDVIHVMTQGADGTGCTSAVVFARDKPAVVHGLIRAVREGWDKCHEQGGSTAVSQAG